MNKAFEGWMQTKHGKFNLIEPDPEDVDIRDIAWGLSRLPRFQAQTSDLPYSVGAHSLMVADMVDYRGGGTDLVLLALMHDAHEAYIGDIILPVGIALEKLAMNNVITQLKERVQTAIQIKFELPIVQDHTPIRIADLDAMAIEREALFPYRANDLWGPIRADLQDQWPIHHFNPQYIEGRFNRFFNELLNA